MAACGAASCGTDPRVRVNNAEDPGSGTKPSPGSPVHPGVRRPDGRGDRPKPTAVKGRNAVRRPIEITVRPTSCDCPRRRIGITLPRGRPVQRRGCARWRSTSLAAPRLRLSDCATGRCATSGPRRLVAQGNHRLRPDLGHSPGAKRPGASGTSPAWSALLDFGSERCSGWGILWERAPCQRGRRGGDAASTCGAEAVPPSCRQGGQRCAGEGTGDDDPDAQRDVGGVEVDGAAQRVDAGAVGQPGPDGAPERRQERVGVRAAGGRGCRG